MAVARIAPKCSKCGKEIEAICKDESGLPPSMRMVGDNFVKWDFEGHKCRTRNDSDAPVKIYKYKNRKSHVVRIRIDTCAQIGLEDSIMFYSKDNELFIEQPTELSDDGRKLGADTNEYLRFVIGKAEFSEIEAGDYSIETNEGGVYRLVKTEGTASNEEE